MSAVVDFVEDAVGGVVDAVGDAVEWVGDTVGNVIDAVADDPLKAIVQVAAVATGNAWALPIIEGVDVLEEGGSLEDALKGAALTYAVQTGVSFAVDSFAAAGVPADMSGTTSFFDDGSSIQYFDDGSQLVTDTAGSVSAVPAPDSNLLTDAAATGAETSPVTGGDVVGTPLDALPAVGEVAATDAVAPGVGAYDQAMIDLANASAAAPSYQYDTMEQLLTDKGLMTAPDKYDLMSDAAASQPAFDPSAKTYNSMEDLLYDKGQLTDAQYKELTGVAPVVDLSQPYQPGGETSLWDATKDLGDAAWEYAKADPLTAAAVVGGGLALTGALGGQEPPEQPAEPGKKTYTYGQAPTINRTLLGETNSAAADIYGQRGTQLPPSQIVQAPRLQTTFKPLLSGSTAGLGSLQTTYTPLGGGQSYDISQLTPEQIIALQTEMERKRLNGGG